MLTALVMALMVTIGTAPTCLAAAMACHMKHAAKQDCCHHAAIQRVDCCCSHSVAPAATTTAAADSQFGQDSLAILAIPGSFWTPPQQARPDFTAHAELLRPPNTPVQLHTTLLL